MRRIPKYFREFLASARGGSAVVSAMLITIVAGTAGGVIDISRAYQARVAAQRAADAASLAGARDASMTDAQLKAFAASRLQESGVIETFNIQVTRAVDGRVTVSVDGQADSLMLSILGIDVVDYSVQSKAMRAGGPTRVEVAMALDVTGSMVPHLDAMKQAANALVDELEAQIAGSVPIAVSLVPYAGAVNIGNGLTQQTWVTTPANPHWMEGEAMQGQSVVKVYNPGCHEPAPPPDPTAPPPPPPPPSCTSCGCDGYPACDPTDGEGGGSDALLGPAPALPGRSAPPRRLADRLLDALAPPAMASQASLEAFYPFPPTDVDATTACYLYAPSQLSHLVLFDGMADESWEGCVEARMPPYDLTDDPPNSAVDEDTVFIPYFWPDAPDGNTSAYFTNDYLPDFNNAMPDLTRLDPASTPEHRDYSFWGSRGNIWKYGYGGFDSTAGPAGPNLRTGPNRACPPALTPLTDNMTTIESRIAALTAERGGGTMVSEGVMWAWRALSPGAPFSEGSLYSEEGVLKVIVVMSDGLPDVVRRPTSVDGMMGDYTAYGFPDDFTDRGLTYDNTLTRHENFQAWLSDKARGACDAAKAANPDSPIQIYTVFFNPTAAADEAASEALMQYCATTTTTHYHEAADLGELVSAFSSIGGSIGGTGQVRLMD